MLQKNSNRTAAAKNDCRKYLSSIPLFKGLNDKDEAEIGGFFTKHIVEAKSIIYFQGDTPDSINFMVHGLVLAVNVDSGGNEFVISSYQQGAFFAESSLDGQTLPFQFEATCRTTFIRIKVKNFWGILNKYPQLNQRFIGQMAAKDKNLNYFMTLLDSNDAIKKIYGVLKFLYINQNEGKLPSRYENAIPLYLTQERLGSLAKVTRETATRTMRNLKLGGFIHVDHRRIYIIKDMPLSHEPIC